ncbi:MAG TPA: thioredoxin domain-containing protein [Pyrinomonadaceae bacterium]|nr:thioredoxin domain-containing protein [Pyrinomonadaceae bacterium]
MKRLLPFAIIVIVLGGGLGLYLYLKGSAQNSAKAIPPASVAQGNTPAVPVPGAEPAHARGPANAPVTMEEFADFQCSACGGVYPILKSIESEFGPRLRVIFREYPLTPPHEHAVTAAHAAEAAGLQGKFWEMHDMLYENQATWAKAFDVRPLFEDYARRIGLDVERFKNDQTRDVVETRIFLDGRRGHSLGVTGTPTIFLNGVELPWDQIRTVEGQRAAINKALNPTGP